MEPKEIQKLIDFISKSGLDEVNVETADIKLKIKKHSETKVVQAAAPAPVAAAPAAAPTPAPAPAEDESSKYHAVKSPMIGTYYASPNPESPAFVSVGDTVQKGQTICIVEAMKLFNEIESDVSGKVVKILVDNASPVEFDQPLLLVDPS